MKIIFINFLILLTISYPTFEEYKQKFNKIYLSPEDEQNRRILYNSKIEELKKLNKSYFGVNKFTDRYESEMPKLNKQILNKFQKTSKQNFKTINFTNLKGIATTYIPDSYFSCDIGNNYCGETINQGTCGSCYAAAVINDAQIKYSSLTEESGHKEKKMFSIQQLIDCSAGIEHNNGCCGGTSDIAIGSLTESKYLTFEDDYNYIDKDFAGNDENLEECKNNFHECKDINNMKKPLEFIDITYFSNLDWETIKLLIYTKRSFITSMYVSNDFEKYYDQQSIWSCEEKIDEVGTNHAVIVDGYGIKNSVKYLWVRNSWGDDWGYNGHFRISFEKSCGINDKIDIGVLSDNVELIDTYLINNFVTEYKLNDEFKSEEGDENKALNLLIVLCIVILMMI